MCSKFNVTAYFIHFKFKVLEHLSAQKPFLTRLLLWNFERKKVSYKHHIVTLGCCFFFFNTTFFVGSLSSRMLLLTSWQTQLSGSCASLTVRNLPQLVGTVFTCVMPPLRMFQLALLCMPSNSLFSVYIQAQFDFIFCNRQQTTNYRLDIPWVLQRFSINCETASSLVFLCTQYVKMPSVTLLSVLIWAETHTCALHNWFYALLCV